MATPADIKLSVVMPCLNEADTVGLASRRRWRGWPGRGSPAKWLSPTTAAPTSPREIAEGAGARVVSVAERGYGAALMAGIAAARGEFVLMGDADDSYDFQELPKFLPLLSEGCDLVQGCRLPSGGGVIRPGAMPSLHRWFGIPRCRSSPSLVPCADSRHLLRDAGIPARKYRRAEQRCTGMEFATEMIVKADPDATCGSAKCRSRCTRTDAVHIHRTCARSGMAGGR